MKKSELFKYIEGEANKMNQKFDLNFMSVNMFLHCLFIALDDDDIGEFMGEDMLLLRNYVLNRFDLTKTISNYTGYMFEYVKKKTNSQFDELEYQCYVNLAEEKCIIQKNEQLRAFDFFKFLFEESRPKNVEEILLNNDNFVLVEKRKAPAKKSQMSVVDDLVDRVKGYQRTLLGKVFGQDVAVSTFISGYFQSEINRICNNFSKKPAATFLFAGPPGTGKTYLSECVADILGLPFKRFDMSEYSDKESGLNFAGTDRVYKNAHAGFVTSFVKENPRCVILFDEIEKAHLNVIHLFLQILDAGRLKDTFDDEYIDFRKSIIFITTNAGKTLYEAEDDYNLSSTNRKEILKALASDKNPETKEPFFPAAICSRFSSGNVVMFNRISAHSLRKIAADEFNRNINMFSKSTKIDFDVDKNIYSTILLSEGANSDARNMKSKAISVFNSEIFELLRLINGSDRSVLNSLKKISFKIDIPADPAIEALYRNIQKFRILVFADEWVCDTIRHADDNRYEFICTSNLEEAKENILKNGVDFVLCDYKCGIRDENGAKLLNIFDIESEASEFFGFIRNCASDLPVYIIESIGSKITDEEKITISASGAQGVFSVSREKKENLDNLLEICEFIHQQNAIIALAKSNKIITYETSQRLSEDKTEAIIEFYAIRLCLAPDTEDKNKILDINARPNVSIDDVIGADDVKAEMKFYADYLKNPREFISKSLRSPRGLLLYGPPGTGKTMLAKALATLSDATFIAVQANEFLKNLVGDGAAEVRNLFKVARKYSPSIIFIDEIDAIGQSRDTVFSSDSGNSVLNALLNEMDGFKTDIRKPVLVMAATNFSISADKNNTLDAALVRRFDRRIFVDLPSKDERVKYIKKCIDKLSFAVISDEEIEDFAIRTTGKSIADIEVVIDYALRNMIRSDFDNLTYEVLSEALDSFYFGEKKEWDAESVLHTSRHEAGHAVVSRHFGHNPTYVTVVSRGDFGGYMLEDRGKKSATYTKKDLFDNIAIMLGGRAAEIVCYGETDGITTGPSSDLQKATALAESYICDYGMDDMLGMGVLNPSQVTGEVLQMIRARVNEILDQQLSVAIDAIKENFSEFEAMVDMLVSKNHLTSEDIKNIFDKK